MQKYTADAIQKKMDRDASIVQYVVTFCARVKSHTCLPIYISTPRFLSVKKRRKNFVRHPGMSYILKSTVTLADGVLRVDGLTFHIPSCKIITHVKLSVKILETAGSKKLTFENTKQLRRLLPAGSTKLTFEIRNNYGDYHKVPQGTAFETPLDMLSPTQTSLNFIFKAPSHRRILCPRA
jgi:hypothetical protein